MTVIFSKSGPLAALSPADRLALCDRRTSTDSVVRSTTAAILERVSRDGDRALCELARELDGVDLASLEVPDSFWNECLAGIAPDLRAAMERTFRNLASVSRAFAPRAEETEVEPGVIVGRRPDPLARVGVYAPGGRAAYPSSVLMCAVPARVAGVGEVIVCSPPAADGRPSPAVLAAAALAGVDRVFAIGGAGAIAAMAFGTASVPRVDRIVGPGNAWVAEAKLQISGTVSIDCPAGPSELLVIADDSVDPRRVAQELIAQAEHDPLASAVVVALDADTKRRIAVALVRERISEPRLRTVIEALAARGALLLAETLDEALAFAAEFAPEHLLLAVRDADAALARVRNAGAVFVGASSSVAFGDYMTGANHVLPTGGLARSYSGLSPLDFVRWTSWQRVTPRAAASLAPAVATFAEAEGLSAHAVAARSWEEQ
ncbi:MAG: histidinol dehydrogenase [Candidatus Eisenbacteria bacterium]|nr:histidinol dehydrogenase [Candidatus Eisenbacteria bacterium]